MLSNFLIASNVKQGVEVICLAKNHRETENCKFKCCIESHFHDNIFRENGCADARFTEKLLISKCSKNRKTRKLERIFNSIF